jgi:multiple sugar transport system substrate-binding protein
MFFLCTIPVFAQGTQEESKSKEGTTAKEEITFWDMNWGNENYPAAAEKLVEQFNGSQNEIKVTYQSIPWDNYYQQFLTAVKGGVGPDVATAGAQLAVQFAKMGEILEMDDLYEEMKVEDKALVADFAPGAFDTNLFNGHYIAMPTNSDPRVFMYRKDYFEKAGITEMPRTWDELLTVLRKLKKAFPDKDPLTFAGDLSGAQHFMLWILISNDTGPVDKNGQANFNNPRMLEGLQFVAKLVEEGLIPKSTLSYKNADMDRLFMNSGACIVYSGARMLYLENDSIKDKVGIMDAMMGPSATAYQNIYWSNNICAFSQTKHPAASKTFIKWWLGNNKPLWTEGGNTTLPMRLSYFEDSFFQNNVFAKEISKKIAPYYVHVTYPISSYYPAFGQINGERFMGEAGQKVLSGRTDFEKIMNEGQSKTIDAVASFSK